MKRLETIPDSFSKDAAQHDIRHLAQYQSFLVQRTAIYFSFTNTCSFVRGIKNGEAAEQQEQTLMQSN